MSNSADTTCPSRRCRIPRVQRNRIRYLWPLLLALAHTPPPPPPLACRYLLARAIQIFTPGIPMVYYVGLLAGTNDTELAELTGSERFLNRHYYGVDEAKKQLERAEVQSLLGMLKWRNEYPAFRGAGSIAGCISVI